MIVYRLALPGTPGAVWWEANIPGGSLQRLYNLVGSCGTRTASNNGAWVLPVVPSTAGVGWKPLPVTVFGRPVQTVRSSMSILFACWDHPNSSVHFWYYDD